MPWNDLWNVNLGPLILETLHYPSGTFIDEVRWRQDDPISGVSAGPDPVTAATEDSPVSRQHSAVPFSHQSAIQPTKKGAPKGALYELDRFWLSQRWLSSPSGSCSALPHSCG